MLTSNMKFCKKGKGKLEGYIGGMKRAMEDFFFFPNPHCLF